jgi:hypothetical protein
MIINRHGYIHTIRGDDDPAVGRDDDNDIDIDDDIDDGIDDGIGDGIGDDQWIAILTWAHTLCYCNLIFEIPHCRLARWHSPHGRFCRLDLLNDDDDEAYGQPDHPAACGTPTPRE